jgi:DNA-binding transcriptional ArsR family regulator
MLAMEAGVATSTASGHLARLLDARLVTVSERGRFRYYALAGPEVGELIEIVARLSPTRPIASLREGARAHAIRFARRCYDHLAGRLGVALTTSFLDQGLLSGHDESTDSGATAGGVVGPVAYTLNDDGTDTLRALGVLLPANRAVRCCVDWTERRHHLAGALGRGVLHRLLELAWLQPAAHHRALVLTDSGRQGLRDHFALDPDTLDHDEVDCC